MAYVFLNNKMCYKYQIIVDDVMMMIIIIMIVIVVVMLSVKVVVIIQVQFPIHFLIYLQIGSRA